MNFDMIWFQAIFIDYHKFHENDGISNDYCFSSGMLTIGHTESETSVSFRSHNDEILFVEI